MRFIDLKPTELKGLDVPIYENGRNLYKDAQLLAQVNGSYSSATSLAVLSTEEYIKAILILLESEGNKVFLLKNAKSFFTSHKIRHNIAQMIQMGQGLIESINSWNSIKKERKFKRGSNWLTNLLSWLDGAFIVAGTLSETKERIEFLTELDNLKNNGLYVDYDNKLLKPSTVIDQNIFEKVIDINSRTGKFYKMLRILYNPLLKNHLELKEIKRMKTYLKDFVQIGLEGYSFSELNKR